MDLGYCQRVWNEIMNNSAYDGHGNEFNNILSSGDRMAFFRSFGAGQPGRLPIPTMLDASEVRARASAMSVKVFNRWKLLNKIVDQHEALIQR